MQANPPFESFGPRYWFLVLAFVTHSTINGQPLPCGPDPQMTPNCIDACVVCDINGYQGINDNQAAGQEPPGFCTNTAHHMQWIAFIAGSTNLTLTVTPSDCEEGSGLEVGIYQSLDCNTFQLVSNCDGDIQEGQVGVFSNTVPLTIGQYYYFVMDGNMDDVCEYIIRVTSGTTLVPPLADAGPVHGPDVICQFESASYSIPAIAGATTYYWTIDGFPAGEDASTSISFGVPGLHELCVSAYNVCDTSAPSCYMVSVLPSSSSSETASICSGGCLIFGDTTICNDGVYVIHFTGVEGCDSIVTLTVLEQSFVETNLSTTICSTDSVEVGQSWFHLQGLYEITLTTSSGCDSIIHLDLQTITCEIDGQVDARPIVCAGTASGELTIEVFTGNPPFEFTWQQAGNANAGSGTLTDINIPFAIEGLPAGMYTITITDVSDHNLILSATIFEPLPLALNLVAADYNGFNISCFGSMDGQLSGEVSGGTPAYRFNWSTGDTLNQLFELSSQSYSLTVTDAAGCMISEEANLVEPGPLSFDVQIVNPGCDGLNSGIVEFSPGSGGSPPYQFSFAGEPFVTTLVFNGLAEGLYSFLVQDANGCTASYTSSLTGSIIPTLEAGSDIELELGNSVALNGYVDLQDAVIEWIPATGLSCTFCLDPFAMPVITTVYTLQAISVDGCVVMDSLTVRVRKSDTDVYIPNIFSPNGDGINDLFTVFGGRSVKQIDKLSIFSRWGDHIIERTGFLPNDFMQGWDGTFLGKPLQPGVFTWIAEIRFLDDEVIRYKGDLTLIR